MKLSPFVHVSHKGSYLALINLLSLEKRYFRLSSDSFDINNMPSNSKEDLVRHNFIVEDNANPNTTFACFKDDKLGTSANIKPSINFLYLLLTGRCNFDCKYCYLQIDKMLKKKDMTIDVFDKALKVFDKNRDSNYIPRIVLYGGEPLLNLQMVYYIIERSRTYFGDKAEIIINTNSSLITNEVAEFFKTNKVLVSVSIDGPAYLHDRFRRFKKNNSGTFNAVLRGYNILRSKGIRPSVSCTITSHNWHNIKEILDYFNNDLGIEDIDFNIMKEKSIDYSIPFNQVAKEVIKGYVYAYSQHLYIQRVFRRKVIPFFTAKPWIKDCAGYGQQLVVTPEGLLGPCQGFWPTNKYFDLDVNTTNNISGHPIWNLWNMRVPYNNHDCISCEAISLCGGGCAAENHNENQGLWGLDTNTCTFSKESLNWLIWYYIRERNKLKLSIGDNVITIKPPSWSDQFLWKDFISKLNIDDRTKLKNHLGLNLNKIEDDIFKGKLNCYLLEHNTMHFDIVFGVCYRIKATDNYISINESLTDKFRQTIDKHLSQDRPFTREVLNI